MVFIIQTTMDNQMLSTSRVIEILMGDKEVLIELMMSQKQDYYRLRIKLFSSCSEVRSLALIISWERV